MLRGISNKRGFSLIDAIFALCITAIGIIAIMSIMPQGWKSSRSSDERSRAAMIMHGEIEKAQTLIANPCNADPTSSIVTSVTSAGGSSAVTGAETLFTVTKTFSQAGTWTGETGLSYKIWNMSVTVLWPGTSSGVSSTHQIMQMPEFAYPTSSSSPGICTQTGVSVSYN
jgi:Tfp pilus assembly protein PilV